MPDLNLRHLRALGLIARRGSISAAADAVGLSQPALTQGLAKLEQQFGVRLFDRLPRGLRLTTVGAQVLARTDRRGTVRRRDPYAARCPRHGRRPEPHLSTTQIRALLSLMRGADAEAATRPSVRRALRDLERSCGTTLTERRAGGLFLTDPGRAMARGFALGVAELDVALQEAALQPARVVVGAMALSRSMLVPVTLAEMSVLDPQAQIDVVDGSYGELVDGLRDGTIDMVIGTLRDSPGSGLRQEILLQDRITVIGRRGHPLVGHKPNLEGVTH